MWEQLVMTTTSCPCVFVVYLVFVACLHRLLPGPSHTWVGMHPLHANNSTGEREWRMSIMTFWKDPKAYSGQQNTRGGELPAIYLVLDSEFIYYL